MQFKLAIAAFAASVLASPQLPTNTKELVSVLSVLETALPSSDLAEAKTSPALFSSQVAHELSIGSTPAWFAALPSDIQTMLHPASRAPASASFAASSNVTALTSLAGSISTGLPSNSANSSIPFRASTATPHPTTSGLSTSGGSSPGSTSATRSSSSASSSGAASMPTAAVGMGLAGVVGIFGVLAL